MPNFAFPDLGSIGRLFTGGRVRSAAGPAPVRRQQVPVLSDAEPLHRQLDDYYLQRDYYGLPNAPLEWMDPPQAPGYRPRLTPDEQGLPFDLPVVAQLMQQFQRRA